ncbi:hypothetical protein ACW6AV_001649 [Edwardsiella piscicida]|uniref:hypothetical protein n=1 Tax=Edwardsiella piscicida TaxID=1263550 RepID=UPI00247A500F|nr:hypothetical protein [Edwardsiella piscicida]WGS75543.1 hypothetical protein PED68_09190 [Edwardsiella piscicida]WGS78932.1 hypothetical protein PED70_09195 [Edwardsiella piscicida]
MKIIIALAGALSLLPAFHCSANQENIKDLVNEMKPYISKGSSSPFDACRSIASSMVEKHGSQLSDLGKTPAEIRESSLSICLDALSQAENAQSKNEISMWKNAALKNIEMQFKDDDRGQAPRYFLTESIDKSAKLATLLFLSMHDGKNK